jgi:hypothetical protein
LEGRQEDDGLQVVGEQISTEQESISILPERFHLPFTRLRSRRKQVDCEARAEGPMGALEWQPIHEQEVQAALLDKL